MDDGACTLDESVNMLAMAADHGTTDLVCTPHANLTYRFDPEEIREKLAKVQARSKVHVYSGCDFHLSFENIQDAIENPQKYTIDHKRYLLVEFSDLLIFHNTAEILGRLQDAGMIPIITHPERNSLLRQRIDKIAAWVEAGTRVQVTAQSLIGEFGRRAKEFSLRSAARSRSGAFYRQRRARLPEASAAHGSRLRMAAAGAQRRGGSAEALLRHEFRARLSWEKSWR